METWSDGDWMGWVLSIRKAEDRRLASFIPSSLPWCHITTQRLLCVSHRAAHSKAKVKPMPSQFTSGSKLWEPARSLVTLAYRLGLLSSKDHSKAAADKSVAALIKRLSKSCASLEMAKLVTISKHVGWRVPWGHLGRRVEESVLGPPVRNTSTFKFFVSGLLV